jgi:hypothetical protein
VNAAASRTLMLSAVGYEMSGMTPKLDPS